uniref:DUF4780 domain-containing protein n=1 Tax=Rhodnius prolixus TaxID=13249 RepID=T1I303_RHOPR
MALFFDSYSNDLLGTEQADLLQRKLVDQVFRNPRGIGPQFWSCFLSRGALIVVCEMTRLWLKRVVPELQVGEGVKLSVRLARDVMRAAKVAMWVSSALKDASLESFKVQNEGLDMADWRVINRMVDPKRQTLVFDLSEQILGPGKA